MTRGVRTAVIGLLGVAVLLVLLAGVLVLRAPDDTVRGEVVASGGNVDGCYPTAAYRVDGTTYRTTAPKRTRWCDLALDGPATVFYDPDSPQDGRLDRYGTAPTRLVAGAVGVLVLAGLALVLGRAAARRRAEPPLDPGPLPVSAWLLALSCLLTQVWDLLDRGPRTADDVSLWGSMLLGALVVGWLSLGVLLARPLRSALVVVVLLTTVLVQVEPLLKAVTAADLARALAAVTAALFPLGALAWYRTTSRFAWHRQHPRARTHDVAALAMVGVLVGVLGGLATPDPTASFSVQLNL
ncbi:hypothetical protein [Nocardioides sp. W7]|uniref:DUF3592 domain-containing protein n=1 Tax=Nocardioides sp. W7 TaxID=2931390 RepID=UPI001FD4A630|nr:hypothetical protein [Nocardioides sp. W7]